MSKLRDQIDVQSSELQTPEEGDLQAYVIFTQLKQGAPHVYAGWLDAADDEMALHFAKEHYGQDQECVNIWAIPRPVLGGNEQMLSLPAKAGPRRAFLVFLQEDAGDAHVEAGVVEASSPAAAMDEARARLAGAGSAHSVWVVDEAKIARTTEGEVIWRLTDQSYRLARGYSKDVRDKWEKIRDQKDLKEYEKDDLKDAF